MLKRLPLAHLAVITNRGSNRNLRGDNWVDPILKDETEVSHFEIDGPESVGALLERCAEVGAETIVVNGGDGTAGLVFAALLNGKAYSRLPALALLPAGKTNMTTSEWSLTGSPEGALKALLRERRAGTLADHIVTRPVLTLARGNGEAPLYGAFFGAADIVEGIRLCRRHIYPLKMPNAMSHVAAIALLLWRGLTADVTRGGVTVHEDEKIVERGNFFIVLVTALDEMLLGLRPVPGHASENSTLNYVSLRMGASTILAAIPGILRRLIKPGRGRTVERLERITLRFTGTYTLDGELYETTEERPLTLDGHRKLNFIWIPA